jgi:hypothetical protein
MTTKATRKTTARSPRKASSRKSRKVPFIDNRMTFKSFFRKLTSSPLPMYLGSGVATLLFARWAFKFYKEHPEVQDFIRENFDTVEDKLREYKDHILNDQFAARH